MIRINLLHSGWQQYLRSIPLLHAALVLVVVAVVGGGLYGIWGGLFAGAVEEEAAAEVEPAARADGEEILEVEEQVPARPMQRLARRQREGGKARDRAHQRPAGSRRAPQWSSGCIRALKIFEHIPAAIRVKGLTGNATGEYSVEGLSPSSAKALENFKATLKTFSRLDSLPTLQREGKRQGKWAYKFIFRGQFEGLEKRRLKPISPAEAKSLFDKMSVWARQSGLGEVSSNAPIQKSLETTLVHQRQKIWAKGSYQQISAFVGRLSEVEESATVGELVMVPIYRKDDSWDKAQLYTAVDVLVQ